MTKNSRPLRPPSAPISVIITCHNDARFLGAALTGVQRQILQPAEVLVVDDESDDAEAVPAAVAPFAEHLPIRWHRRTNGGLAAARNTGLELTTQPFVAFLDADDHWMPAHLARAYSRLTVRADYYSTAYNGFIEFDDESGDALPTIPTDDHDGPIRYDVLGRAHGIPAGQQFQLHRRSALQSVSGFDPQLRMAEDFDLLLRMARKGYWISGSGEAAVWRRVHPRSLTRDDPRRTLAEMEKYLQKAEREHLLSSRAVAVKRKALRLTLGRKLVNRGDAAGGVALLKEAFGYAGPQGLSEWLVRLVTANEVAGRLVLGLYTVASRYMRRTRLEKPSLHRRTDA